MWNPGLMRSFAVSLTRRHVFTPFFTTKQNGQGLGLTIVQEILRRHGFDYSLDGPPGGPTVFRVGVGSPGLT
jgi:signal transduction histidine kinase